MTTGIDDILDRFATGFQTMEDIQYLRDIHASHEALLKAAKEMRTNVSDQYGTCYVPLDEAIRAAEELGK